MITQGHENNDKPVSREWASTGPTGLPLRTVYLCDPSLRVTLHSGYLKFKKDKQGVIGKLPLMQLRQIVAMQHVGIAKSVLSACLERQIPVTLLNGRGELQGHLLGARTHDVSVRISQYKVWMSESLRLKVARRIVQRKLENSVALMVQYAYNHRGEGSERLRSAAKAIREICTRAGNAESLEALRGYEGAAAREYFGSFGCMLKGPFTFTTRTRRPPRDPVNALLSFGYTILAQETASMVESVGLDSYLGFLHAPQPGYPALALDLIEPLRSKIIDRLAVVGINLGVFTPDDFEAHEGTDGAVLLNDSGRKKFFARYESTMSRCTPEYGEGHERPGAPRRVLEDECLRLKRHIMMEQIEAWDPQGTPFAEHFPYTQTE